MLGWDRYQGFVARRYLMIPEKRVTPLVRAIIVAALVVALPIGGAYFLFGAGMPKAVLDVGAVAGAVLVATLVVGVLPYSKPALYTFYAGAALLAVGGTLSHMSPAHQRDAIALLYKGDGLPPWFSITVLVIVIAGAVLAMLALFFGVLRAFFTFFTTVPIGGVWIGTMALVCVLSVMSGFESDLREKILGSNAHINVTREDGDIDDWRAVKARIDAVPGVVASTPYAQSEVVIAAGNNGMNVIIKGIDPKTVGKVTQLVSDICVNESCDKAAGPIAQTDQAETMKRLDPLFDDHHDLDVKPRTMTGPVIDPGSGSEPSSEEPIDFSQPADAGSATGSAGSNAGSGSAGSAAPVILSGSGSAGSGSGFADIIPHHKHGEIIGSDSFAFGSDDTSMRIPIDATFDSPAMSRRTQSLPGVLIGKELLKQTHMYQGEEVRVVSPLSDPSNPDATGTPIPFNRDYRVAGVFFTGMYEYDLKYVYVTLDSLQEFLDRGSAVDGIEVRVTSPDDTDVLVPRIAAALGSGYRVQDWKELNHSLFSALKLEKIAMFLVLGIVILVASFSIVGNLIMVVVEKGREIALLKTLGASDAGVMQLFAIQGLLIGVIGTSLGVLFGLGACWIGKHYGIPLNPDVYYIDRMPVNVDASSVVVTFLAGVVISIAATFYPALLAARIRPAAGIRH
ncbi:MAG TPA: ABC transporter permease [Kofleriaceae bacterium]|jgi:lipoprotein-releasing system permease protein